MKNTNWVLIDTESTGLTAPIFVVEIAAQKMCGWNPVGPSFRRLVNQNTDISPEAARVHGYTREILERDGHSAHEVYRDFAKYVENLPLVAYNLSYDLDDVLLPEWARLGIKPIGSPGFCVLKLAQRLLDPVPAGNCKLQTLRQYYRLPERGAHTALGDVETVADLLTNVLCPISLQRGLISWAEVTAYTKSMWYPSRIAFGKHKGRNFREAREDTDLRNWLTWLSSSKNERSAHMGSWYIQQLDVSDPSSDAALTIAPDSLDESIPQIPGRKQAPQTGIALYAHPGAEQLRKLIAASRSRLAELEAQYTQDLHAVDVIRSALFGLLRPHYQARDRVRLVVNYRRKYLSTLLQSGEDEAETVAEEFVDANAKSDADYEELEIASEQQKTMSPDEEKELRTLWKKLVRLYHPDRFANEPEKIEAHHQLTSAINQARDNGDLATLREIANDPQGFMLRNGWASLDFNEMEALADLQRLLEMLQLKVVATLESLNELHESPDFELQRLSTMQPELLAEIAKEQAALIKEEIDTLESEAEQLREEIDELAGMNTTII